MTTAARELHVTSPELHGPDVLAIQQRLKALGYQPGPLDSVYGPSTFTAVEAFQRAHHLRVDGVVGPVTRLALAAPKPLPHPTPPAAGAPGPRALAEALKHLGVTEKPAGSNLNPFGAWFGVNGVPWCNIFASYCFEIGAGYTLCKGFPGPGVYAKGCTYVPTTEAWLRATYGFWLGRVKPQPGDIAIYNWDGGVPDHIGIVEHAVDATTFTAIEGNTGSTNNSNGGEVMRQTRYLNEVDGFGRCR